MRIVLAITLALLCQFAQAGRYPAVTVAVQAEQVGPHSYYFRGQPGAASGKNQGFMSNAGFVVTKDGVVVFDSLGTPSLAEAMVREIRRVSRAPIRRVIVSHYHADHYYGLQVFKELGAEIWAHEQARGILRDESVQTRLEQRIRDLRPWVSRKRQRFVEADVWLEGDTAFELGGLHFEVRHVGPAHSPEDLALFVVEDRVLYAGDLVFRGRIPFIGNADSHLWLAGLDRLTRLAPQILVPGHGAASTQAEADLAFTRDYLRHLRRTMGAAARDMTPFEEAYAATDWSSYEQLPAFEEANRRNAYSVYLQMETAPAETGGP